MAEALLEIRSRWAIGIAVRIEEGDVDFNHRGVRYFAELQWLQHLRAHPEAPLLASCSCHSIPGMIVTTASVAGADSLEAKQVEIDVGYDDEAELLYIRFDVVGSYVSRRNLSTSLRHRRASV